MNSQRKAVLDRIKHLEDSIGEGREYLETEKHAHWHGFRPLFTNKKKDGGLLPPHRDWIRSVFPPEKEKARRKTQEVLARKETDEVWKEYIKTQTPPTPDDDLHVL